MKLPSMKGVYRAPKPPKIKAIKTPKARPLGKKGFSKTLRSK